jgi:hypothetical protein
VGGDDMSRQKHRTKCPGCGRPASGDFCPGCGAALEGSGCPNCGSRLSSGSKFCNSCGHALGASRGVGSYTPSVGIAAAAVVLVMIVVVTIGPFGPKPPARPQPPAGQVSPAGQLPATGTVRAEADRYFDEAMRAHETGDSARAAYAGAIALGAYSRLPEPDADTRFHLGLLHEIMRDEPAILAQADSIELSYPNHLFAYLLRRRVHARRGDSLALKAIYRDFLEAYDLEMSTGKEEYELHRRLLDALQSDATRAIQN